MLDFRCSRSRRLFVAGCVLCASRATASPQFPPVVQLPFYPGGNGSVFEGASDGGATGNAVARAGDVNADGREDLLIGARSISAAGTNAGAAYVVFGGPTLASGVHDLGALDGTNGFVMPGVDPFDWTGGAVSAAGDFNGDGRADLLVAAENGLLAPGNAKGLVYVVYGGPGLGAGGSFPLSSLAGPNGFVIEGVHFEDRIGRSVACAGDVNGDGFDDVLIGAPAAGGAAQQYSVSNDADSIARGDIDGDGKAETIVSSPGQQKLTVFRYVSPTIHSQATIPLAGFPKNLVLGDFDSDGDLDIASASTFWPNGGVSVISNLGTGSFAPPATYVLPEEDVRLIGGDIDGDGDLDLVASSFRKVVSPQGSPRVYVLVNDGAGGFSLQPPVAASVWPDELALADLDGDGDQDLIVLDSRSDEIDFFANVAGALAPAGSLALGNGGVEDLLVADLDQDGDFDLAGASGTRLRIAWSHGGFAYPPPIEITLPYNGYGIACGDVDADGDVDILVSASPPGDNGQLLVLRNTGGGSFLEPMRFPGSGGLSRLAIDDIDDDGHLDLIGCSHFGVVAFFDGNGDGTFKGKSCGETYLVYGGIGVAPGGTLSVGALNGPNGVRITGPAGYQLLGESVCGLGDVDGDGYADFALGSPGEQVGGPIAGAVYVVRGGPALGVAGEFRLSTLDGSTGFVLRGGAGVRSLGIRVDGSGDVNGDRHRDLIAGASDSNFGRQEVVGGAVVLLGRPGPSAPSMSAAMLGPFEGFRIRGVDFGDGDGAGRSVSIGGDLDGDGFSDIAVGAPGADLPANNAGNLCVVFGSSTIGHGGDVDLASLDGPNGFTIRGESGTDLLGVSTGLLPDLNGDSRDDLVVGAQAADTAGSGSNQGKVYLLSGARSAPAGVPVCSGDGSLATACPCGNTGTSGRGCANSTPSSEGARLTADGTTQPDTVVLAASAMPTSAFAIYLQGDGSIPGGVVFGDGVRCVGGLLKRLAIVASISGASHYPSIGDPSISARSASLGDPLSPGDDRWYQAYYRDPVASFCPVPNGNSWNVTNGMQLTW